MKKLAIIFAMQKELDLFAKQITGLMTYNQNHLTFYRGNYQNFDLCLTVSGIGKVNAALSVANLMQFFTPDLIINIGVSGGLDKSLKISDIVVADEVVYHDVWCGSPAKLGQVWDMPETYHPVYSELLPEYKHGLLVAGDWFMTEPEKLKTTKTNFPKALAVDMESAAIAQCCFLYNCPLMVIRQISDVVGTEKQDEIYNQFWKNAPEQSSLVLRQVLTRLADLNG